MAGETGFIKRVEYEGVPYEATVSPLESVLGVREYDDIRDDDVLIWTFPKCGTHWVGDIANKIMHGGKLEASENKLRLDYLEFSVPVELAKMMMDHGCPSMMPQSRLDLSALSSPRVLKTHLKYNMLPLKIQEGKAKVIYVFRDPRDAIVSFFYHTKLELSSVQKDEDYTWPIHFEASLAGNVPWGNWWDHYKGFQDNRNKPHILGLFYEDMQKDLKGTVREVANFLGKSLSDDVIESIAASCTFEATKTAAPRYVLIRKGNVGDWKSHFTVAQCEAFDKQLDEVKKSLNLDMPYVRYSKE